MKKQLFFGFIFLLFVGFIACEKDDDTTTPTDKTETPTPTDTTGNGTPTDTTGTPTDTTGNGTITPSTLTLNTFDLDGTTYTITEDLTANAMASLDIWGASGYTSDFKSSISISLKITDAIRPSTTVTFPLMKNVYVSGVGNASVTLTVDSKPWYSEGGKLNVVVDSKGDIAIHFTDITFGDNAYGAATATVKGSGNNAIKREYKGEFSFDSLGLDYTNYSAILPVTESVYFTSAGFIGVNQHNISAPLSLYFKKGSIAAGSYTIVPVFSVDVVSGAQSIGVNEVSMGVSVAFSSSAQKLYYYHAQSGTVTITKSDGDVHFEFKDIPVEDGEGKTDKISGSFDCKDM